MNILWPFLHRTLTPWSTPKISVWWHLNMKLRWPVALVLSMRSRKQFYHYCWFLAEYRGFDLFRLFLPSDHFSKR